MVKHLLNVFFVVALAVGVALTPLPASAVNLCVAVL